MGEMEAERKIKRKSRVCVSVSSCGQYFGTSKTAPWCWILTTLSFFTASSQTCMPLDSSTSTRPRYYKDRKEKTELKRIGWNRFFPNFCCYRWWLSSFILHHVYLIQTYISLTLLFHIPARLSAFSTFAHPLICIRRWLGVPHCSFCQSLSHCLSNSQTNYYQLDIFVTWFFTIFHILYHTGKIFSLRINHWY